MSGLSIEVDPRPLASLPTRCRSPPATPVRAADREDVSLEVVHPDATGIDIGNEAYYVEKPPVCDWQSVRHSGCATLDALP